MGTRVVHRYILNRIDESNLRVFMVWLPISPGDDRAAAEGSASHITDPRVTHLLGADLVLTEVFKEPVGLEEGMAWDLFLLYDKGALWGETPPVPSSYMHQRLKLPIERTLDARVLADEVRALLEP